MKFLVSFVLLFNVCAGKGVIVRPPMKENYQHGFPHDDYHVHYHTKHHYQNSIIRPCSVDYQDEDCIRRVFTSTFNCMPTHGPVPDPYLVDAVEMNLPNCNMTFTNTDAKIKGLSSGKIKEFYINKETGRVVLAVSFDSIINYSPKSIAIHHREGMEPIEIADYTIAQFKSLSLTLVISNVGKDMWKTRVYSYLANADIPVKMGPAFEESKDPLVIKNMKKFMENLVLSAEEAFLTLGPQFMSVYLQSNICDFRHHQASALSL